MLKGGDGSVEIPMPNEFSGGMGKVGKLIGAPWTDTVGKLLLVGFKEDVCGIGGTYDGTCDE